jgi:hypothetical protein
MSDPNPLDICSRCLFVCGIGISNLWIFISSCFEFAGCDIPVGWIIQISRCLLSWPNGNFRVKFYQYDSYSCSLSIKKIDVFGSMCAFHLRSSAGSTFPKWHLGRERASFFFFSFLGALGPRRVTSFLSFL